MRLRNNPKAYEIMEENADLVILKPEEHKGHYHDIFEINQPLYIEIGMGKGDFIYQNALKHPENNYIGIEKFPSVLAAAINKINKNQSLPNLKLMHFDAIELENVFENGEIDQWLYDFKYKPHKSDTNVSKELMYEEITKILFGIKLKDVDTIMNELNVLKDKITSYREPYKCETCAVTHCDVYALGCRNCSGWK